MDKKIILYLPGVFEQKAFCKSLFIFSDPSFDLFASEAYLNDLILGESDMPDQMKKRSLT